MIRYFPLKKRLGNELWLLMFELKQPPGYRSCMLPGMN
jgi:hypothetical protein